MHRRPLPLIAVMAQNGGASAQVVLQVGGINPRCPGAARGQEGLLRARPEPRGGQVRQDGARAHEGRGQGDPTTTTTARTEEEG
eukprot:7607410-Pyramimonas_sp.AAC.1